METRFSRTTIPVSSFLLCFVASAATAGCQRGAGFSSQGKRLVAVPGKVTKASSVATENSTSKANGASPGGDAHPGEGGGTPGAGSNFSPGPVSVEISLTDVRFKSYKQENLTFKADLGGVKTEGKLVFSGGMAKLVFDEVPRQADLTVEFYEGAELRARANKSELKFTDATNSFKLADCRIVPVRWAGDDHLGNCSWQIRTVSN